MKINHPSDILNFDSYCCPCHTYKDKPNDCCYPRYWCEDHVHEAHEKYAEKEDLKRRIELIQEDYKIWSWQHLTLSYVLGVLSSQRGEDEA